MRTGIRSVAWLIGLLLLASCTHNKQSTFTDPFAYCAAVGTIDAADHRYTGPQIPLAIALGLRKAFGAPKDAPLEPFTRNTFWRCMGGKVYACNVGANLPCQEKADTSRTPNQGMVRFCTDNPDREVIPAYAAGRATVYLWRCREGRPEIVRQVARPDAQGYLSHIWYQIEPGNDQAAANHAHGHAAVRTSGCCDGAHEANIGTAVDESIALAGDLDARSSRRIEIYGIHIVTGRTVDTN